VVVAEVAGTGDSGGTPSPGTAGTAMRNPDRVHCGTEGNRSVNVLMVRSKVKEENVADVQAALEKVFQAIEQAQPAGVRYAATRLSDGVTFVALLEVENSEDPRRDNPLLALPAYAELRENLKQWYAEPSAVEHMTVVGSYRLF
jgi:hypothetical protein